MRRFHKVDWADDVVKDDQGRHYNLEWGFKVIAEISVESGRHLKYHRMRLPIAIYARYRDVVSYSSFFNTMKDKPHYRNKKVWFYPRDEYEMTGPLSSPMHGVPFIEHDTIWDFYKAVGWNWKTKKWESK